MEAGEARADLVQRYKGIEKARYFEDYCRISAALGTGSASTAMLKGLRTLEEAIKSCILQHANAPENAREVIAAGAIETWNKRRADYAGFYSKKNPKPEKNPVLSHVLTEALQQREIEDGFKQSGVKVPIYVGVVSSSAFIKALRNRHHWKDVGAGTSHGEFTHRIQWFLLSAGGVLSRHDQHPAKVFSTLGDFYNKMEKQYLWDDLCDRLGSEDPNDWRKPERLHTWLKSPASLSICPLLSTFLQFRSAKREANEGYIKKKLGLKEDPKKAVTILDFKKNEYQVRK